METKLIAIGVIVLLVAWIVGRRGRVEYIDEWVDEEEELLDEEIEKEFDLPEPVSDDSYDDEDIELVDLDQSKMVSTLHRRVSFLSERRSICLNTLMG